MVLSRHPKGMCPRILNLNCPSIGFLAEKAHICNRKYIISMDNLYMTLSVRISAFPRGSIFFVEDLLDTGLSHNVIRAKLSQMVTGGSREVVRLARGIFCRPALGGNGRMVFPTGESVAQAAAQHWRVRIVPTGAQAANLAGFYGVPVRPLDFVTDGSEQFIHLSSGNTIHFFRRKSLKVFFFQSERLRNLVEGVRYLGPDNIGDSERDIIARGLLGIPEGEYVHDLVLSPGWIRDLFLEIRPAFT